MVREAPLRIESFSGDAARRYVPELARLRIEVFRDFPYLYAGSTAYEEKYLRTYTDARDSVVVIAFDDGRVVGAATALPLDQETQNVTAPYPRARLRPRQHLLFRRVRSAAALSRPRRRRRLLRTPRGMGAAARRIYPCLLLRRRPAARPSPAAAALPAARRLLATARLCADTWARGGILLAGPRRNGRERQADAVLDEGALTGKAEGLCIFAPLPHIEQWVIHSTDTGCAAAMLRGATALRSRHGE